MLDLRSGKAFATHMERKTSGVTGLRNRQLQLESGEVRTKAEIAERERVSAAAVTAPEGPTPALREPVRGGDTSRSGWERFNGG